MIGENKSLTLKHGGLHYEPLINRSTTSLDLNWPGNHSYDIFDNADQVSEKLQFCNKICNKTDSTTLESIINMVSSFNLPLINEELGKNKKHAKKH